MFTHTTELHARIVLHNLFNPFKQKVSYDDMSRVTYTSPEVASFGLSELELKERGIKYTVQKTDLHHMDRARTDNTTEGIHLLYLSKKGKLLGGTVVAHNSGEIIQELVLAKQNKLGMMHFLKKTYAYPVATRINQWSFAQYFLKNVPSFMKSVGRLLYKIC